MRGGCTLAAQGLPALQGPSPTGLPGEQGYAEPGRVAPVSVQQL